MESDWRLIKSSIDSRKPELGSNEVREKIIEVLHQVSEPMFPDRAKDEIQAILRRSSPWSYAKTVGKSFIPSGQPSQACERLLTALRTVGLHIVEVGELEGFVRMEGGHGPKWVNAVLKRDLLADKDLDEARRFVQRLVMRQASVHA